MQAAINLVVLLLKPDGSDRPITVTSLVYALWTAARGVKILRWDQQRARHWDSAIRGSSPLRAAWLQRLDEELWQWRELHRVTNFKDMEKCYDSIDTGLLLTAALDHGFEPTDLAVAARVHLAPRVTIIWLVHSILVEL